MKYASDMRIFSQQHTFLYYAQNWSNMKKSLSDERRADMAKNEHQRPAHRNLLPAERQNEILNLLTNHNVVTIPELAQKLDTSDITIRRDLASLSKAGLLKRVRGGRPIQMISNPSLRKAIPFHPRLACRPISPPSELCFRNQVFSGPTSSTICMKPRHAMACAS